MAINTGKVITGGLAAGVVMNVIDIVTNLFLLKDQFTAEMNALNPKLMPALDTPGVMAGFVICDFVMALLIVWTYAAIRPRFGPGSGTATKAGLVFFAFGTVLWGSFTLMGMFSMKFFLISAAIYLVNVLVTANVGAMVYKED